MLAQARSALQAILAPKAGARAELERIEDLAIATPGGVLRARCYLPRTARYAPLIVYFHGGGFVCCDVDTHDSVCAVLSAASGARLLSVDYRLAPETPFPGQIEDARAACAWAGENAGALGAQPGVIAVAGDSAGAYLAASIALEFNRKAAGAVALQVLLYPLVHLRDSVWAQEELRNFRILGRLASRYITHALGAQEPPSLLEADLRFAPPSIIAGGVLLDPVRRDANALADALRKQDVRVVERDYPFIAHGAFNFASYLPTADKALREVGQLIGAEMAAYQS
jgi:acetyl esterase